MSRQISKSKRKAVAVKVPDLKEDAAERKRLLNVLAQRRYRERKREHLKSLESRVESSSSSPQDAAEQPTECSRSMPKRPNHDVGDPASFACRFDSAENTSINPAIPVGVHDIFCPSPGWTPEPFTSDLSAWPSTTLWPSLPASAISTPLNSTSSPEQATDTSTTPSSLGSVDWPPIDDINFTSALQSTSIRSYTFPDERYTDVLELKLLRGCMMIAKRMNIEDLLWSLDSTSPFTDPALSGLSFDHLPPNLRPTKTQQLIPHHPVLDILAWPTVRDKLIMVLSQEPEERPPIAASPMALMDLVYDIEDSAEGVRIWGDDPCNAENWEVGEAVFKKWWWALDSSIIGKSNKWRRERGAPLLGTGGGFVVGEE